MFSGLNAYLGLDDQKSTTENEFITITNSNTDGSFLLHHFIATYLVGKRCKICLFSLSQTFTHYSNAAQKLGIDLKSHMDIGQFHLIDGMQILYDSYLSEDKHSLSPSTIASLILTKLKQSEKSAGKGELPTEGNDGAHQPWLVIIDDVSQLLNAGRTIEEIGDLILMLKSINSSRNTSFLTLTRCKQEDDELDLLNNYLRHESSLLINVNALQTGYSPDLDGELEILSNWHHSRRSTQQKLHFKLQNKDVKLFAPGTSSAVL